MGLLATIGIAKNDTASTASFEQLLGTDTFLTVQYATPQEYVQKYWTALKAKNTPTLDGNVFEFIIYTLLYRENIKPFYTQAQVAFVPNVNFDTILYNKAMPVSLSLKTSLRERYKQADLEAIALKYIYRKSKCYLLTMDTDEANRVKRKIMDGDVIGLDEVIDCNTEDINRLIDILRGIGFITSVQVEAVKGNLVQ